MVSKGRSPRYPRISLGDAIVYAGKLYDEAHTTKVDSDTAVLLMGFKGKSGASAIALGAVRQYGLVSGLRGDLEISELALEILQPLSPDEQAAAKQKAAFLPEVFASLHAHFSGNFPRSDEPIRAHLIRSMGFSQTGAADCIASLRKTLSEIESSAQPDGVISPSEAADTGPERSALDSETSTPDIWARPKVAETQLAESDSMTPAKTETVRIPLSKSCRAELKLIGDVDEEAITRLLQYIDLMKDVWTE